MPGKFDKSFLVFLLALVGCLLLTACEEAPTPLPVGSTNTVPSATVSHTVVVTPVNPVSVIATTAFTPPVTANVEASVSAATPPVTTNVEAGASIKDSPIHTGAAVAYDESKQRITAFGGQLYEPTRFVNTTWVWNDRGWQKLQPKRTPPIRVGASMVYDAVNRQLVMFGGSTIPENPLNDTWLWDGENWTRKQSLHAPPARNSPSMVYDAARKQVVLFGGIANDGQGHPRYLNDTWLWDGQDWTLVQPATSPGPRFAASIAYAPSLVMADSANQVILYGGYGGIDLNNPDLLNDTWTWDGHNWHKETVSSSTEFLTEPVGMAYDPKRKLVVLLGSNGVGGEARKLNQVSYWDGHGWQSDTQLTYVKNLKPANIPWNEGGQAVYDPSRQAIVLFTMGDGGKAGQPFKNEIWLLQGQTWKNLTS